MARWELGIQAGGPGSGRHPGPGSWAAVEKVDNHEYSRSRGWKIHPGARQFSYRVYDARSGTTLGTHDTPESATEHAEGINKGKKQ